MLNLLIIKKILNSHEYNKPLPLLPNLSPIFSYLLIKRISNMKHITFVIFTLNPPTIYIRQEDIKHQLTHILFSPSYIHTLYYPPSLPPLKRGINIGNIKDKEIKQAKKNLLLASHLLTPYTFLLTHLPHIKNIKRKKSATRYIHKKEWEKMLKEVRECLYVLSKHNKLIEIIPLKERNVVVRMIEHNTKGVMIKGKFGGVIKQGLRDSTK